jgi:hypothetical protein
MQALKLGTTQAGLGKETLNTFLQALTPFAWLCGHALATALGFCVLVLISLIPIGVLKLLVVIGITSLVGALDVLEKVVFFGDIGLFVVVVVAGIIKFIIEITKSVKGDIKDMLDD